MSIFKAESASRKDLSAVPAQAGAKGAKKGQILSRNYASRKAPSRAGTRVSHKKHKGHKGYLDSDPGFHVSS